ncbi:MAG: PilZ domain-containing protein [Myxococcales bacterium]|nr:PilZ domain-containing protein [Myxococcales bacterium]
MQVHAPTEDVLLLTYALNLSTAGAFVRANRPLPVGTKVRVELCRQRERISLEGVVVRVEGEPRGMGMRFDLDASSESALERLVDRVGREALPPAADAAARALYAELAPPIKG